MQNSGNLCSKNKPEEFESLLDQFKFIFAKIRDPKGPHCPSCHPEMKIIAQQMTVRTTFPGAIGTTITPSILIMLRLNSIFCFIYCCCLLLNDYSNGKQRMVPPHELPI